LLRSDSSFVDWVRNGRIVEVMANKTWDEMVAKPTDEEKLPSPAWVALHPPSLPAFDDSDDTADDDGKVTPLSPGGTSSR
jgi:hypothetical protein